MFSRLVTRPRNNVFTKRNYSTSVFRNTSSIANQTRNKFEFNWADRAKSAPTTLVQAYKDASSKINDLKAQSSTDLKVPSIDWAYWEKEITTPGVVAKLRKEYESQKFDEFSVSEADIQAKNKIYDEQIDLAEQRISKNRNAIADNEKALKEYQFFHDHPEKFSLQDMYRLVPGIEQELQDQFWAGHYNLDPEEEKNDAWDPNTLIHYFETGGKLEDLPNSLLVPHLPQKYGNVDLLEIVKGLQKQAEAQGLKVDYVSTLPKFREPKDHHDLLPILAEQKAGAPVFGAPIPGHPEGSQSH